MVGHQLLLPIAFYDKEFILRVPNNSSTCIDAAKTGFERCYKAGNITMNDVKFTDFLHAIECDNKFLELLPVFVPVEEAFLLFQRPVQIVPKRYCSVLEKNFMHCYNSDIVSTMTSFCSNNPSLNCNPRPGLSGGVTKPLVT